jgi:Fe-S oxidoreductase
VRAALDTCLSCKSCKSECPVSVDMATYKAEFMSQYYLRHRRPRRAYTVGLIHKWARIGSTMPAVTNFMTQTPGLRTVVKRIAGIAEGRQVPVFAGQTFRKWFLQRPIRNHGKQKVLLWPDTFNNHFHPEVAQAAVEVLEHAGFQVSIPQQQLCCGRPLYDFGMLDQAKAQLADIMRSLADDIDAGVPLVGLEPGCMSTFRDELVNLFPHDARAKKLSSQSFMLSEFLEQAGYVPGKITGRGIVHAHCHQRAVFGIDAERSILAKTGMKVEILDSGCCGMAGSYGFDPKHLQASLQIGEKVLLPAVRNAPADTRVIVSGFSCREQVHQGTARRTLHLAEVLRSAIDTQELDRSA